MTYLYVMIAAMIWMALGFIAALVWYHRPKDTPIQPQPGPVLLPEEISDLDLEKVIDFCDLNDPTLEQLHRYAKKNCVTYKILDPFLAPIHSSISHDLHKI